MAKCLFLPVNLNARVKGIDDKGKGHVVDDVFLAFGGFSGCCDRADIGGLGYIRAIERRGLAFFPRKRHITFFYRASQL